VEPVLRTSRLALRRFTAADGGHLLELDGDPAVMRYLEPRTKSRAEVENEVPGSRRVLEKAGLRYARTVYLDWPDPLEGNEHGDVEYRLTRGDWPG
jgi:RimJ/RimL family protein N-acetyltransferase